MLSEGFDQLEGGIIEEIIIEMWKMSRRNLGSKKAQSDGEFWESCANKKNDQKKMTEIEHHESKLNGSELKHLNFFKK